MTTLPMMLIGLTAGIWTVKNGGWQNGNRMISGFRKVH